MTTMTEPTQQLARREGAPAQTAVAKRSFEPLAPIGSVNALKSLLETQKTSIAGMLPKHITPERILKTMLVAVNRNPDILKCTQASILETINRAAELGLDLSGTLGEAYPVPFNNRVKFKDDQGREHEEWKMQLQLIIGYRGYEKLAWQSGEVESIDAEVVRTADRFKFVKGTEVFVEWSPALVSEEERGQIIGAYACVKMKGGGKLARFLPIADIEKIRQSSKSANSPAWRNWWDEMARKCALKRTLKDAPLSTEKFVKAMEHDESDFALADVVEAEVDGARGTAALTEKLRARNAPPLTDEEAERILREKSPSAQQPAEQPSDVTESDVDQPPEEAPSTGPLDYDELASAILSLAKERHVKDAEKVVTTALKSALIAAGKKNKTGELTSEWCAAQWKAAQAAQGYYVALAVEAVAE